MNDRSPTPTPGNILVVDDTPANLQLLSKILNDLGHTVRPVPNGKLALQAARNDPPDIVLLDIMMPEITGYEVLEKIKSDEKLRDIRVIMISALSETDSVVRCIDSGADDYLRKPFQPTVLEARINSSLERKRLRESQRDLHEQLIHSYEDLKEAQQARDGLLHMIVHDLNNPLTSIVGFVDLAIGDVNDDVPDKKVLGRNLRVARGAAESMTALVRSILDISKMEAGEMPVSMTKVDLVSLLKDICERFQAQAKLLGIGISFKPERKHGTVRADQALLTRILQNLMGNALKHTPKGAIVKCSLEENEKHIVLAVEDNGPGIPADLRDKVFEKFFQIEARKRGKKYGVGLGLAFCRMAVEAQNGKIWVEGEEGKGACFKVALPKPYDITDKMIK